MGLMITPRKIAEYADSVGVEFSAERSGREWSVECYAPEGKLWHGLDSHFLALPSDGYYGTPDWKQTMDVLQQEIANGFDDCHDDECDICNQAAT